MLSRYRLPLPPALRSTSNAALASAVVSRWIDAMVNPVRSMTSLELPITISPVVVVAVEFAARHVPWSWAMPGTEKIKAKPATAQQSNHRFVIP